MITRQMATSASATDWRTERTCQLTVSEFVAIILLDREALKHNHFIDC
jgi:hypothetical protein